jgi:hypothetical protein
VVTTTYRPPGKAGPARSRPRYAMFNFTSHCISSRRIWITWGLRLIVLPPTEEMSTQ